MNSTRSLDKEERGLAEFLNSAIHNLRKILECDPEVSTPEIEAIVMKLPLMLRDAAPLLARSNDDMPITCLSFDA